MSHSPPQSHESHRAAPRTAFTLVEMLVVIGIVAVLAAILLPAVMVAINRARIAAIGVEIAQLSEAVEAYRKDKGDYPPNFRDYDAVMRHVRRCYPKMTTPILNQFVMNVWGSSYSLASPPPATVTPNIDEGESLVFWLSMTHDNQLDPFGVTAAGASSPFKKYYEFDEKRLVDEDPSTLDGIKSYRAKHSRDTCYIYMEHRNYMELSHFGNGSYGDSSDTYAFAEDPTIREQCVRPYWSETPANPSASGRRNKFKPVNATSFQIVCAGLDGDFGLQTTDVDVKHFPVGLNYDAQGGDDDNITNFSEGARLSDKIP